MRFGEELNMVAIPQWKECYLNYETLKIFVMIIKEIVQAIVICEESIQKIRDSEGDRDVSDTSRLAPYELIEIRTKLMGGLLEENQTFFKIYTAQAQIIELFYQMKVICLKQRYGICQRLSKKKLKADLLPLFLMYIEYSYVEVIYIAEMREANMAAERKILKKHKKYAHGKAETPEPNYEKINRMGIIEEVFIDNIQNLYTKVRPKMIGKEAKEFLREAAHNNEAKPSDYFLFGLGVGTTIAILTTLIFIIFHQGLSIENTSAAFSRDFPAWRGIAIFILYIWILGFNVYCFERFKISHRLIFSFNDHHYSTSSSVFKIAGFFTSLFMVVFLIYLLLITNIIRNVFGFRTQYLVLIVWSALGIYIVIPLPIFNYQGRLYAVKLLGKALASPIIGVEFSVAWMTDQWISMATPLRDLAYTVCYFTRLDLDVVNVNPCKDHSSFEVTMLVIVIAISYKIMQAIRVAFQEGRYWMTTHMASTVQSAISLITAIISYFYDIGNSNLLGIWIITSFISTIYSYLWDLKQDWALLQPDCKNWLLRKYLTFQPKGSYYIVIILNFVMRLAWMMTLSPNIALYFGNSALLTFVTGCIEIIRRGIWNLLKVEKEHLKNCREFRAIPDMKNLENQLQEQDQEKQTQIIEYLNEQADRTGEESRELMKRSYIELIKKKIQERDLEEKPYNLEYMQSRIKQIRDIKQKMTGIAIAQE